MSLNKKNISQLLNCGLDEIEISLDGLSPDENDQVRRQGSAKKVIANLKNLIKAKTSSNSNLSINIVLGLTRTPRALERTCRRVWPAP